MDAKIKLWESASKGDVAGVIAALDSGVGVDALDNRGDYKNRTALMHAATAGHLDTVDVLIRRGAKLNLKDAGSGDLPGGNTPLLLAVEHGHTAVAHRLLDAGADASARSGGATVLGRAAFRGDKVLVERILHAGVSPNELKSRRDDVPLHSAILGQNEEIVELLLKVGADPNLMNVTETSALTYATSKGLKHFVKQLLDHGADPNGEKGTGFSPLLMAVTCGHEDIAELLIDRGADVNLVSSRGETALDICERNKLRSVELAQGGPHSVYERLASLLHRSGAKAATELKLSSACTIKGDSNRSQGLEGMDFVAFRTLVNDTQSEWAVFGVKSSLEQVIAQFLKLHPDAKWRPHVKIKSANDGDDVVLSPVPFVEVKGGEWTIVLWEIMTVSLEGIKSVRTQAKELSNGLKTRAISFAGETTSDAISYELYDSGKLIEKAEWIDGEGFTTFKSKIRAKPKLDEVTDDFVNELFRREGIYLPACYVATSGREIWLAVEPASAKWIGNVTMIEM